MSDELDAMDFIEELGERFPDLTDYEVCREYEEYSNVPFVVNPDSYYGYKIMEAYNKGANRAKEDY